MMIVYDARQHHGILRGTLPGIAVRAESAKAAELFLNCRVPERPRGMILCFFDVTRFEVGLLDDVYHFRGRAFGQKREG